MKYIHLILMILLLAACQEQQTASTNAAQEPGSGTANTLSPDDPGYVAEDPRLAGLIDAEGRLVSVVGPDDDGMVSAVQEIGRTR